MKKSIKYIAFAMSLTLPSYAVADKKEDKSVSDTVAVTIENTIGQTMSLNGQLNLDAVTATVTSDATVTGIDAATSAVTAAAIANSLTSDLDFSVQQANLGDVVASLSSGVTDATATAAAIGNSASLSLTGAADVSSEMGQFNTAAISATIEGSVSGATDVTAAAIGNSLSITNAIIN